MKNAREFLKNLENFRKNHMKDMIITRKWD